MQAVRSQLAAIAIAASAATAQHVSTIGQFAPGRAFVDARYTLSPTSGFNAGAYNAVAADGHSFVGLAGEITTDSLLASGVDTLFLTLPTQAGAPATAEQVLSEAEAATIESFVRGGGKAIVAADAYPIAVRYNNLVERFGLAFEPLSTGAGTFRTIVGSAPGLTDGPFGTVSAVASQNAAMIDVGDSGAYALTAEPGGFTSLAALGPGQLGAGAGWLIVIGDTTTISRIGSETSTQGSSLLRNAFGLTSTVVPQPGVIALAGIGLALTCVRRVARPRQSAAPAGAASPRGVLAISA